MSGKASRVGSETETAEKLVGKNDVTYDRFFFQKYQYQYRQQFIANITIYSLPTCFSSRESERLSFGVVRYAGAPRR